MYLLSKAPFKGQSIVVISGQELTEVPVVHHFLCCQHVIWLLLKLLMDYHFFSFHPNMKEKEPFPESFQKFSVLGEVLKEVLAGDDHLPIWDRSYFGKISLWPNLTSTEAGRMLIKFFSC